MTENERRIIAVKVLMTAVDLAIDILQDEALEPQNSCIHPEDARVNLTVMGGSKKWLCMLCGHQFEDGQEGEAYGQGGEG